MIVRRLIQAITALFLIGLGGVLSHVGPMSQIFSEQGFTLLTPLIALAGVIVAWKALRQRDTADNQRIFFQRLFWALGSITSSDPRTEALGWAILRIIVTRDRTVTPIDKEILRAIEEVLESFEEPGSSALVVPTEEELQALRARRIQEIREALHQFK